MIWKNLSLSPSPFPLVSLPFSFFFFILFGNTVKTAPVLPLHQCHGDFRTHDWKQPEPLSISLFLASTVSALHRNAHIWNASHPLLVTYYCWVTVYSPGMEAKKNKWIIRYHRESNLDITDFRRMNCRLCHSNSRTQWVVPCQRVNDNLFKLDITTFFWGPKNSVNAENIESFIYMLFKLYVQV